MIWTASWPRCSLIFDKFQARPSRDFQIGVLMFDLQDKIALVTGASGGIGAEIATALHAQGATVVLHGTRAEKLESLKAELGERAFVVTANLADREAVAGLIDAASTAAGGAITILVNNAGITRDGLLMRMKDEDWDNVISTNLTGTFNLTKAFIKNMIKNRSGRVINISSVSGLMGNPGQVNYSSAKAGLSGFTKSLAKEVGSRGITVNSVAPGFIETDMTSFLDDDSKNNVIDSIPLNRFGDPKDVAKLVAFLASEEAGYITGQTISVDGGLFMH